MVGAGGSQVGTPAQVDVPRQVGEPMQVLFVAPQVAVPLHDGYSGQVTLYEQVDDRGLQVGSEVQVGLRQVWNAAQLASTQV